MERLGVWCSGGSFGATIFAAESRLPRRCKIILRWPRRLRDFFSCVPGSRATVSETKYFLETAHCYWNHTIYSVTRSVQLVTADYWQCKNSRLPRRAKLYYAGREGWRFFFLAYLAPERLSRDQVLLETATAMEPQDLLCDSAGRPSARIQGFPVVQNYTTLAAKAARFYFLRTWPQSDCPRDQVFFGDGPLLLEQLQDVGQGTIPLYTSSSSSLRPG